MTRKEKEPPVPTVTAREYKPHDELRWYPAKVEAVEEVEGMHGAQFKWTFEEPDGTTVYAWCSQSLSSRSKLGSWFKGLTGRTARNGEQVNLDQFVGVDVGLQFEHVDRDGQTFDRVKEVAAASRVFGGGEAADKPDDNLPF